MDLCDATDTELDRRTTKHRHAARYGAQLGKTKVGGAIGGGGTTETRKRHLTPMDRGSSQCSGVVVGRSAASEGRSQSCTVLFILGKTRLRCCATVQEMGCCATLLNFPASTRIPRHTHVHTHTHMRQAHQPRPSEPHTPAKCTLPQCYIGSTR